VCSLQVSHLAWFLSESSERWSAAEKAALRSTLDLSVDQFWLQRAALWLAVDFEIHAPLLFAFAARWSLVHSYLGVSYATVNKWHRCGLHTRDGSALVYLFNNSLFLRHEEKVCCPHAGKCS
jgi:hypothetical protein